MTSDSCEKLKVSLCPHLLVFAVRLLSDVFGFFELHLLDLHLLLIFHGSVLNHLHASEEQKDRQPSISTRPQRHHRFEGSFFISIIQWRLLVTICMLYVLYVFGGFILNNMQMMRHTKLTKKVLIEKITSPKLKLNFVFGISYEKYFFVSVYSLNYSLI